MSTNEPKQHAPADDAGIVAKLLNEAAPLSAHDVNELESYIAQSAAARRSALGLLTVPWSRSAERIANDLPTAQEAARLHVLLADAIQNYRALANLVESAHLRLTAALCLRADRDAIIADAVRAGAGAELH